MENAGDANNTGGPRRATGNAGAAANVASAPRDTAAAPAAHAAGRHGETAGRNATDPRPRAGTAGAPAEATGASAGAAGAAGPLAGAAGASVRAAGASVGAAGPVEQFGPECLDVERELAVFLRRARASSGEMARQVHPDLEPAAYGLLVRLEDAGEQRATELAAYFGVGKATISRQLHALEQLGLVDRRPDPGDRRASLVRLTDEGRERFTRVRDARRLSYARKLAAWDRREIAELARLLHRLNSLGEQEE
ncbi:hypothetical protein HMPREF1486_02907 [Streptomyces sp. HPH0547]|nr:hypothetical protein HMPREF1486_02907 [Streptomyces sp. HPH0547]